MAHFSGMCSPAIVLTVAGDKLILLNILLRKQD